MQTISKVMQRYLGTRPPEPLRSAVTPVFLKSKGRLKRWQKEILANPDAPSRTAREIKPAFNPAIHNAMVLCHLIGDSGKVRDLFNACIEGRPEANEDMLALIQTRYQAQFSEYFCLGVVPETLELIISQLQEPGWDPLTEELSCPFSEGTLRPLALLYGKSIPWTEYHASFNQALSAYQDGKLEEADKLLTALEAEAIVRLPVLSMLRQQLHEKLQEAQSYFTYLQEISS